MTTMREALNEMLEEGGRLGFKDIEKLGRSAASRIDNEARRTSGYANMSPGEQDQLRYKIAKKTRFNKIFI